MFLSALYRYPVKSGQAQSLVDSPVDLLGLRGDRRWMVVEQDNGRFLTQRAWPGLGQINASYDEHGQLLLQAPGQAPLAVPVPESMTTCVVLPFGVTHCEYRTPAMPPQPG